MSYHSVYDVNPRTDHDHLPMQEVVKRIGASFPIHRFDAQKGKMDTEMRLAALTKLGAPQVVLESYRYPGVYCYVYQDDSDGACLDYGIDFMIWPLQGIGVVFYTPDHEAENFNLLERLAETLGYEYELAED